MAISLQVASSLAASSLPGPASVSTTSAADAASPFAALFGNLISDPTLLTAQGEAAQQAVAQTDGELTEGSAETADTPVDAASQALVAALFAQQTATMPAPVSKEGGAELPLETADALAAPTKGQTALARLTAADASVEGNEAAVDSGDGPTGDFAQLVNLSAGGESLPEMAATLAASGDPKAAIQRMDALMADASAINGASLSNGETSAARTAATAQPTSPSAQPLTAQYAIAEPLGGSRWSEAIGQRALFMVEQQVKTAELHLNPPHLGPMEVKLSMDGDKTSLSFITSQAAVKEAVMQSLPRLHQVFADNGMTGLDVQVQLGFQQSQPENQSKQPSERQVFAEGDADEKGKVVASNPLRWQGHSYVRARGGVDIFA